jgi:hypothetical protein
MTGAAVRWLMLLIGVFALVALAACHDDDPPAPAPAPTPASITTQPADRTATVGNAVAFSVTAAGDSLSYQWQRSTDAGANWANVAGATSATLSLATVDLTMSGQRFRVVVTGVANAVTSSAVALTVNAAVVAPAITVDVASVVVTAGANASFSVTASGTALNYQWQNSADGVNFASIAGATSPSLVLNAVAVADSGRRLRVLVSNSAGSVTSSAATLTVNPAPAAPVISTQPANAVVTAGQTASFTVAASGTPVPSYQWQLSTDGGASFNNVVGAVGASLTTAATSLANNGQRYRVVVSNSAGAVTSSVALLSVNAASTAPVVTTQPLAATVSAPAAATFSVTASGTPSPTFQWQLSTDGGTSFSNINGATATSYTTPATVVADSGKRYRAVVSNSAGSVNSAAVVLTVNPPPSLFQGGAWTAPIALETGDADVLSHSAGMDGSGRVMVLFVKSDGSRDVLYATRGTPNATGVAPTFTPPVVIDSGAPVSASMRIQLVPSPNGNAVASWFRAAPCSSSTYKTSGTCNYLYMARYLAATATWEAPLLLGDQNRNSAAVLINDAGDVLVARESWVRQGFTSWNPRPQIAWRANGQATFNEVNLDSSATGSVEYNFLVTLSQQGRFLVVLEGPLGPQADLTAVRGSIAGTGVNIELLDAFASPVTMHYVALGEGGEHAVVWDQNNGTRNTRFIATTRTATGAWTVVESPIAPPATVGAAAATVTATGVVTAYELSTRQFQRQVSGVWSGVQTLPAEFTPAGEVESNLLRQVANNLGWLTVRAGTSCNDGSWSTYDEPQNTVVKRFGSVSPGTDFILGVNTCGRDLGMDVPLLASNGVGALVMRNRFDVLPSATNPAGSGRNVVNLWLTYFKPAARP